MQSQFLTLAGHAAELGLAEKTVRNHISAGSWPAKTVKIGGRRLVQRQEHDRLVNRLIETGHVTLVASS